MPRGLVHAADAAAVPKGSTFLLMPMTLQVQADHSDSLLHLLGCPHRVYGRPSCMQVDHSNPPSHALVCSCRVCNCTLCVQAQHIDFPAQALT